jgi:uncharacterized membrane protein YkgB
MLYNIILILLFLMILGALPTWPHSQNWGYYPSSGLGLVLVVVIVLMLLGRYTKNIDSIGGSMRFNQGS